MMTVLEIMRLQGIPDGRLDKPSTVTDHQLRQMVGNAFSVNVFARVLPNLFKNAGLVHPLRKDAWQ